MGDEGFKRRLVHSVAVANCSLKQPCITSFIANVLKCKAHLKVKFKCASDTMYS